jgi:fructose-specific PTS system IIA-like component
MALESKFICSLPNGVHARPASALEEVASCFSSEVILTNGRTGRTANAKSVLAIVGADIRQNDDCLLSVAGLDAAEAVATLSAFLRDEFPHCDDALPLIAQATKGAVALPSALSSPVMVRRGTPVVKGIGRGRIVQTGGLRVPESIPLTGAQDSVAEVRRLDLSLTALTTSYERRLSHPGSRTELDLLKAHRSIARDPEFRAKLHEALRQRGRTAAGAIADTEAHFSGMLRASESALLRERALDIQDVCFQLLIQIYGKVAASAADVHLTGDSVVVAETLTAGQLLALDHGLLKGLVLGHAGTTSHTVILARSFGIPTLTGVIELAGTRLEGSEAVVDAELGLLVTTLTEPARRYYALEEKRLEERRVRQSRFASQPAVTSDGHRLEIAANIETTRAAARAFEAGAESIGLFRTEMLFFDRDAAPNEEEQFMEYRQVLETAGDRSVIIRTLDVGGDKPLAYLNLPREANPFLGCRAVRLYPEFEFLFRTQIRALVRASAHGQLKVMVPMISTVDEARWVKRVVAEEQARCLAKDTAFNPAMPVGAMIEVPAVAFAVDALARELDFFSIGSNDLLQYFMAVDRGNPRVGGLYNPLQPAFVQLLKHVVDRVHTHHKWIGLCGEMGGEMEILPLLVGLGLDEISVAAPAVARLKASLTDLVWKTCRQLVVSTLNCATADEVRKRLEEFATQRRAALLDPELIAVNADAITKAEAIKLAVDRLYVVGRTEDSRAVEEAVWRREEAYSTGFGHGFAIPHCKTGAVQANSLVMVKLSQPVAWGSIDGEPVSVVILLAMRETNSTNDHMKILAKLARRIMDEQFRARLEKEADPQALYALLAEALQIEAAPQLSTI